MSRSGALSAGSRTRVFVVGPPSGGDDTAAIEAKIQAAKDAGGGLVQLDGGSYSTAGGHVLDQRVRVVGVGVEQTVINHTGNTVCFQINAPGITGQRIAVEQAQLIGNAGASAVGIEVRDTNFDPYVDHLKIRNYTAGVGLLLHNATAGNFTEGFASNDLSIDNCLVAVEFRRTNGTNSFNGTRLKAAVNLNAGQTGILIGGPASTATCWIYNSDIEAQFWLNGNNAVAVRNGAFGQVERTRIWLHGEEGGAVTGIISLRNDEGGIWATTGQIDFNTDRLQVTPANTFINVIWAAGAGANTSTGLVFAKGSGSRANGQIFELRDFNATNPTRPGTQNNFAALDDSGSMFASNFGLGTNTYHGGKGAFMFGVVTTVPSALASNRVAVQNEAGLLTVLDSTGAKRAISGPADANTTGLTSAQIDALFKVTPPNGTVLSDATNGILLVRQNGKWAKTAALTVIA